VKSFISQKERPTGGLSDTPGDSVGG